MYCYRHSVCSCGGDIFASTYYISPTGNDSANGSSAAPWATLVKAMSSMKGGDTLIVNDGTYTGASNAITHNGTYPPYGAASAYTTIRPRITAWRYLTARDNVDLFNYDANSVNDAYWQFKGWYGATTRTVINILTYYAC